MFKSFMFSFDTRIMEKEKGPEEGGGASTPETITEEMMNSAIKAAVQTAITANNTEWETKVTGLKENKNSVLSEKKILQDKLKELEQNQMVSEGDLEGLTLKANETARGEYEPKLKESQDRVVNLETILYGNKKATALEDAATKLNIKPSLRSGFLALIGSDAKYKPVVSEDFQTVTFGKLSLDDFTKEWSEQEIAKDYILTSNNSGGGAPGSNSGNPPNTPVTGGLDGFIKAFPGKK